MKKIIIYTEYKKQKKKFKWLKKKLRIQKKFEKKLKGTKGYNINY